MRSFCVVRIEPSRPPGDAPCPACGHLLWFAGWMLLEELEFVVPEAIVRELAADSKPAAIESLVQALADAGRLPPDAVASVAAKIMDREELGATLKRLLPLAS